MSKLQNDQQDKLHDAIERWLRASIEVQQAAEPMLGRPGEWCSDFVGQVEHLCMAISHGRYDAQVLNGMTADQVLALMDEIRDAA